MTNADHYFTREGPHDMMAHIYYSGAETDAWAFFVVLWAAAALIAVFADLLNMQGEGGFAWAMLAIGMASLGYFGNQRLMRVAGRKLRERCPVCRGEVGQ